MKKNSSRLLMFSIFILLFAFSHRAQTTITIGTGASSNSSSSYPAPYGNRVWGAKHQLLLRASELTAAGMTAGSISKIAFHVFSSVGVPLSGFTIRMASTSTNSISSNFINASFTTVYGPQTFTDSIGWNPHVFSTPFYWNGTSNIIIETCFNNTSTTTLNPRMYSTSTAFQSVGYNGNNTTSVCSSTSCAADYARPDLRITFISALAAPTIKFGADKTFSCNGLIQFTDSSCCNISSRLWDFGDGTTSTLQNPVHTYTASGTYSVKLIATNSYGSDSLIKNNYINVSLGGGVLAANCTPATTAYCCGFGITNVTLNTINNTTADASDGYKDYTCSSGTTLYAGAPYAISISMPQPAPHNVMVWIDYNNDGILDSLNELAFSAVSVNLATGNITIPGTAVVNTPLRMRVSADFEGNTVPTPCSSLQYGQAEDYSIIVTANTNPPVTYFTADNTTTCDGLVNFTDNSTNIPLSWHWDFGDGSISSLQNPSHIYSSSGNYAVTLITSNNAGTDTLVKNNYIHVTTGNVPVAATCNPPTTSYCCSYGIFNVKLNSINNSSAGGSDGYKDYSCSQQTTLTQGNPYSVSVQTSPTDAQDTRIWVDLNNNGIFESTELLFSSSSTLSPTGTLMIPAGAALHTLLRMRVFSDYAGSNPGPCSNASNGQVEDYALTVVPDTTPPIAQFGATATSSCDGIISFLDSSLKIPTSWFWDFGDGTTSTLQNPTHTYTAPGIYSVTLIAGSPYGSDTLIRSAYINIVSVNGGPVSPSCTPATTSACCGMGIYNVNLVSINNSTSGGGTDGYQDYSCGGQTNLISGQSHSINITTGSGYSEYVNVWIDYNNDASFNASTELAYSDYALLTHSGTISVPASAVMNTPLRMRVGSDYSTVSPCSDVLYGQFEDYGVTILPDTIPPISNFSASPSTSCNGLRTFTNTTLNANSYTWYFGDGSTSSQQNPAHTYSSSGVYTVKLVACNSHGCDSIIKTNYINITLGGPVTSSCVQNTTSYCCGMGVYNFTFGSINNSTAGGIDNYQDYSCGLQATVTANQILPVAVTTGTTYSENVVVFIDFNNDGTFSNSAAERAYQDYGLQNHNGTITIPGNAVLNTPLRMRVVSDYSTIYPCQNITNGQAEDYAVIILPDTTAPVAGIYASTTNTCNGIVTFNSTSVNATSFSWDFGDGSSASVLNPTHTYASNGTYSVKLVVCNPYGCDSVLMTNFISVNLGGPIPPSCSPGTTNYCCGMGIYNVTFNTINNTTTNGGSDSYQDYSCSQQTTLTAVQNYSVSVITGSNYNENVAIWIDYNNDGDFNATSELVYSDFALQNHSGTITISGTAILNTPLRMRVASDYSTPSPCTSVLYGQMEDYTVIIQPNTNPPAANFNAGTTTSCNGIITFNNTTVNATSFAWDFGDGTTSSQQNPVHTYTSSGTYSVKMVACNPYGCDSVTLYNYVHITLGGPIPPSCSPTTVSFCCGMGIYNVKLNTINNTTANGGADSYQDYSCTQQTTLVAVQNYSVSVQTGSTYNEYLNIWIDYNNDGNFNGASELAFSNYGLQTHTGTINVPATAVLNTSLRMRVASDYSTPSPCTNVTYGQVEDYAVIIQPNTTPPVVNFSASSTTSCNGIIAFNNITVNSTSFAWDFGDGTTSSQQSPTHTYASNGIYTVKLVACNSYGCDSLVLSNYVNVSLGGPISAACSPVTTAYCCGMGIYNVSFNTINNTTANGGADSYQDYSCTQQTTVTAIQNYSVSVQTGTSYYENVSIWIDYNNDGDFDPATELAFSDYSLLNHSGTITPSGAAVLNTPLRMRVASDYNPVYPCSNVNYGQMEDYTIIIQPNTNPPVTGFNANTTISCNGIISFNNTTVNATSFNWDFGDGTTSSTQNPTHTYTSNGTYSVKLVACNSYGCDSTAFSNYISVNLGGPIPAFCTPATTSFCCGMGIYNVTFNTINNSTSNGIDGYKDYSCSLQTNVVAVQNYAISVQTGSNYNEYVSVWIDYNNDGDFDPATELAFSHYGLQSHSGTINIPGTAVLNAALRMRVASDYNPLYPCTNVYYGQVEDYSITILPNTTPPVANFNAVTTAACNGVIVFNNTTVNATSFAWDFGDGTTSSLQNPTHTYTSGGTYSVKLVACNVYGCDSLTLANYITISLGGPSPALCSPVTTMYCCGIGIYNVTLNTINNTTADGVDGYKDYSCNISTGLLTNQNYSISVQTGPTYFENVKAWIDYNNDGVFDMTNEMILSDSALLNHSANFTVPSSGTLSAPLRMRVMSDYYSVSPCANISYGQSEDYSIVLSQVGINEINKNESILVYPNPSTDKMNINYSFEGKKNIVLTLYNMAGQIVYSERMENIQSFSKTINTAGYPEGNYLLRILSDDKSVTRIIQKQ